MSHAGGGNQTHDEADLSIISSQYNYRQSGNSSNRNHEINFPTQPAMADNSSFLGARNLPSSNRLQGPMKLT